MVISADILTALVLSTLAGLSTTLGAVFVFFSKKPRFMCIAMGFSAGVMLFVSFVELLGEGIANIGYLAAVGFFFAGVFSIMLIDFLIPHKYEEEESQEFCKLKRMGMMVAFGIFIHNLPEGIITLFSSLVSTGMGITIAFAVALHNIPEGIAVSFPIYEATKSKKKAFLYSFFSGVAEPIGAVICLLFLWNFITPFLIYAALAVVAGIMVFISIDELLPFALREKGKHSRETHHHRIILGIFLGMLVMAISMALI